MDMLWGIPLWFWFGVVWAMFFVHSSLNAILGKRVADMKIAAERARLIIGILERKFFHPWTEDFENGTFRTRLVILGDGFCKLSSYADILCTADGTAIIRMTYRSRRLKRFAELVAEYLHRAGYSANVYREDKRIRRQIEKAKSFA